MIISILSIELLMFNRYGTGIFYLFGTKIVFFVFHDWYVGEKTVINKLIWFLMGKGTLLNKLIIGQQRLTVIRMEWKRGVTGKYVLIFF